MPDGRRLGLALAVLIAVTVCSRLVYFERWVVDNDNYITLSSFVRSAEHPDYVATVRRYYDASKASCAPDDPRCVAYAGALLFDQAYSRPLTAFFGSRLADPAVLASTPTFMTTIVAMTAAQTGISLLLMAILLVCFLGALRRDVATYLAAILATYGFVGYWLPEQTAAISFQPLQGVGALYAVVTVALAAAALLYARTAVRRGAAASARPLAGVCAAAVGLLLLVRVGLYRWAQPLYYAVPVLDSQVGLAVLVIAALGIAVFAVAAAAAIRANAVPTAPAWLGLLLLVLLVMPGENFFITAFHMTQKGAIYLLAAPILVYVAVRPNGRLLWLLPLLMLFHVGVAGLLFGCIAAAEVVAGIRRRAMTLALGLSLPLCLAAMAFASASGSNPVLQSGMAGMGGVMARLSPGDLLPGLAVLAIIGGGALVAWRAADPVGDLLLRAVVLSAVLAVAGQLAYALRQAGFDIMDPVAYNYIQVGYYLAPIVCAAGLFLVMIALAVRPSPAVPRELVLNAPALMLLAVAVLALASARAGNQLGRPANPAAAIGDAAVRFATHIPPDGIDPYVLQAAAPNDRYLVGRSPGDAITMMTVLKMKCRAVAGLLEPERATIAAAVR